MAGSWPWPLTERRPSGPIAAMSIWLAIGLFIAVAFILLARSAWMQGELRQFINAMAIMLAMLGGIAAIIGVYALVTEGL